MIPNHILVTLDGSNGFGGLVTALLALFGTVLTVVVGFVTVITTKNAKEQELLVKSLEFLGGGTQKRAVGIALAEWYGRNWRQREMISNILRAQRLYLAKSLSKSEPGENDEDSKDFSKSKTSKEYKDLEQLNLRRIDEILSNWGRAG